MDWKSLRTHYAGETALVLGNGTNRAGLDADSLPHGLMVIGCNRAWRDLQLDFVVMGDKGPARELAQSSGWQTQAGWLPVVVLRQASFWWNKWPTHGRVVPMTSGNSCASAGALAIHLAWRLGCRPVLLAGFSFDAGNIYRGKPLYETRPSPDAVDCHRDSVVAKVAELEADGVPVFVLEKPERLLHWQKTTRAERGGSVVK